LLNLADHEALYGGGDSQTNSSKIEEIVKIDPPGAVTPAVNGVDIVTPRASPALGLHYNIQIHLPATKDVEVYNAIFKSLRNHLIE
jgi:hypothetical protein